MKRKRHNIRQRTQRHVHFLYCLIKRTDSFINVFTFTHNMLLYRNLVISLKKKLHLTKSKTPNDSEKVNFISCSIRAL